MKSSKSNTTMSVTSKSECLRGICGQETFNATFDDMIIATIITAIFAFTGPILFVIFTHAIVLIIAQLLVTIVHFVVYPVAFMVLCQAIVELEARRESQKSLLKRYEQYKPSPKYNPYVIGCCSKKRSSDAAGVCEMFTLNEFLIAALVTIIFALFGPTFLAFIIRTLFMAVSHFIVSCITVHAFHPIIYLITVHSLIKELEFVAAQ